MEFRSYGKKILVSLALTAVFNTIIAIFLTQLGFGDGFATNFIFSQAIGLCMCSFIMIGHVLLRDPSFTGHVILFLVAIPMGAMVGALIGASIAGFSFLELLRGEPALLIQILFIGILFGTMITYFFYSRERMTRTKEQLQDEQIKRLTLEKKTLETHLKLLQAQIEPHFLFNTLSNVLSLLESDPVKGNTMLENLTHYLRSSLSRTRDRMTTLGQEMDLTKAYLDIYKVRLGERLRYTIEIPDALRDTPFPPMLIQPLVENAIKHGIEPQIKGGEILIKLENDSGCYRFVVADTGAGFMDEVIEGIGCANVKERLDALFDGKGRLIFEENKPSGLKVIMEIPHE